MAAPETGSDNSKVVIDQHYLLVQKSIQITIELHPGHLLFFHVGEGRIPHSFFVWVLRDHHPHIHAPESRKFQRLGDGFVRHEGRA